MTKTKRSGVVKNVLFGFGGEAIIMILGIVVPRIMITSYGSDVNGLLNTIGQIYTYMALMEAGIGQAARVALLKTISKHDQASTSFLASIASNHFQKISLFYGLGVIALSALAPFVIKTNVDHQTVFLVLLLHGMASVISFYYIQTITTVLSADGRSYVSNGLKVVSKVISYAIRIVLASRGISIVILQFAYFLISVGKVVFYKRYFSKHYGWIDLKAAPKTAKLPDRNAFILTEIAWTIFSSTDLIVLSVFQSTKQSSVYSVYNLVFANLNGILATVYHSVNYLLGQTYHQDREQYMKLHDDYTSVFFGAMTVFVCTAYTLILPFIRLYTHGITDVDYINTSLPVLFCLVQEMSWSRYITGNLSGVAGFAKPVSCISLIEALVNISLSIILVHRFGITGVLFATVIALPLKVIYLTWLSEKKILKRKSFRYLLILGVNYALFACAVWVNRYIDLPISNYADFALYGVLSFAVFSVFGVLVNYSANPHCLHIIKQLRRRKMPR